jgi:serine/threonine protein kinase/WD40 repeat protein
MAVSLEQFIHQLRNCPLWDGTELQNLLADIPAELQVDAETLARELVKRKRLTAYQARQIYGGKGQGLVLGNYVVLDKLGQGGMGMVLKAEHRRLKRLVALKVLSPSVTKSPEAIKRFQREVEAAAKLRHPNIVATDDADEDKGTHYLVMEYIEGSDLSALVKRQGPLTLDQALAYVLQAARALEYAHSQRIVHRDIKPANLLVDTQGVVRLLDLGLARIDDASANKAELTTTGAVMGTVDFMAPEQAISTKSADARSDIYSLGITLWYLLTGRAAYDGDSMVAKLMAHQTAPIPFLTSVRSDIPLAVEDLFRRMVSKDPAERPQTMTDVIAALEPLAPTGKPMLPLDGPTLVGNVSDSSQLSGLLKGASATGSPAKPVKPKRSRNPHATQAVISPDPETEQNWADDDENNTPWWRQRRIQWIAGVLVLCAGLIALSNKDDQETPSDSGSSVAVSVPGANGPAVVNQAPPVSTGSIAAIPAPTTTTPPLPAGGATDPSTNTSPIPALVATPPGVSPPSGTALPALGTTALTTAPADPFNPSKVESSKPAPPPVAFVPPANSPFDALDAKAIPASERFGYQPRELVGVIGTHERNHWGQATVAFSPDSKLAATCAAGDIVVWNLQTCRPKLQIMNGQANGSGGWAFTENNRWIVSPDGSTVWDVSGAEARLVPLKMSDGSKQFQELYYINMSLSFCESGRTLVSNSGSRSVRVFDFAGRKPNPTASLDLIREACVASIANRILYRANDGTLLSCFVDKGRFVRIVGLDLNLEGQESLMAVSPNGLRAAVVGQETLEIWDIQGAPKLFSVLTDSAFYSNSKGMFSADGRWIVVTQPLETVFIHSGEAGADAATITHVHPDQFDMAISPDSRKAVGVSPEGLVRFWDISGETPAEINPVSPFRGYGDNNSPHFSPVLQTRPGKLLLRKPGSNGGFEHELWEVAGPEPKPLPVEPLLLANGEDGPILPAGLDKVVVVGMSAPSRCYSVAGNRWQPLGAPFGGRDVVGVTSLDGKRFVSASTDASPEVIGWDLTTDTPTRLWGVNLNPQEGNVYGTIPLGLSADQGTLAIPRFTRAGKFSFGVNFFRNVHARQPTPTSTTVSGDMGSFRYALSPDGKLLAHLPVNPTSLKLADISGPQVKLLASFESDRVSHLAYSTDGRHLALVTSDGLLVLRSPSLEPAWKWHKTGFRINRVEWSPENRHLITHNANGTVYIIRVGQL